MHRYLTSLGPEHESLNADEIAYIKKFLEHLVVHLLVLIRTDVITGDIDLDTACRIHQFYERCLAHNASAHHTAGYAYLSRLFGIIPETLLYPGCISVCRIHRCRIRVYAHGTQLLQTLSSELFLIAKFH